VWTAALCGAPRVSQGTRPPGTGAKQKVDRQPAAFSKSDLAFHDVLAEIPRNPIFMALNRALADWLMEQRTVGMRAPMRGTMRRAYRGHEEIYESQPWVYPSIPVPRKAIYVIDVALSQ